MLYFTVEYGKHEMAASLAEKYCDFEILIQLCDDTNNSDRIERYLVQFADKVILLVNIKAVYLYGFSVLFLDF